MTGALAPLNSIRQLKVAFAGLQFSIVALNGSVADTVSIAYFFGCTQDMRKIDLNVKSIFTG